MPTFHSVMRADTIGTALSSRLGVGTMSRRTGPARISLAQASAQPAA
jgi:hypothetical protein